MGRLANFSGTTSSLPYHRRPVHRARHAYKTAVADLGLLFLLGDDQNIHSGDLGASSTSTASMSIVSPDSRLWRQRDEGFEFLAAQLLMCNGLTSPAEYEGFNICPPEPETQWAQAPLPGFAEA
ncbi:hypothetical protein VTJ04DRAFT_5058 [Mycothermus thermophilus]|uniref:uncharacterized protein n=1 Tax=Humicola insolens TaxID=85995 RepID=UPI0037430F90